MNKVLVMAIAVCSLAACSQPTLDFRNAEISNNRFYEASGNEPFNGKVSNVPLSQMPVPKIGEVLKFAGDATGDRSVGDLFFGSAIGQLLGSGGDAITCDVDVDEGRLNGDAACTRAGQDTKVLELRYDDNTPVGEVSVYSQDNEDTLIASVTLDESGLPTGMAEIFHPETGKLFARSEWKNGKATGIVEGFDKESGELVRVGSMVNGLLNGEFLTYTSDGDTLIKKVTYKEGRIHGPYEEYDPKTGKLIKKTVFENGVDVQVRAERESAYQAEANTLVAAGHYSDLETALSEVRASRECLDRRIVHWGRVRDGEEMTPEYLDEAKRDCRIATANERTAQLESDQAEQRAWEVEQDHAAAAADAAEAAASGGEPAPKATSSLHAKPSFNCANATSDVEFMICGDHDLAAADVRLMQAYKKAINCVPDKERVKTAQRYWVSGRDGCTDRGCVASTYVMRTIDLVAECPR